MFTHLPPVTRNLLIVIAITFGAQQLAPIDTLRWLALWPDVGPILLAREADGPVFAQFHVWQWLSYGFLHGGIAHLLLNGLALMMFGAVLEQVWGGLRFAVFFLVCVIGAGLTQSWWSGTPTDAFEVAPTLGASGGVFGILLAYAAMFPRHKLMLLFPPIPMPAWLLVCLFAVVETVLGVSGMASGIAHFAHLGGMATGLVLYVLVARHWQHVRNQP